MQRSELTENIDRLWALVYAIMNIRIPSMRGMAELFQYLLISEEDPAPWS